MNEHVTEFQINKKTQYEVDFPEQRRVSLLVINYWLFE